MARKIRELMTANPVILDASAKVIEAARQMRDRHPDSEFGRFHTAGAQA